MKTFVCKNPYLLFLVISILLSVPLGLNNGLNIILLQKAGLNLPQISIILSAFSVSIFLLEVPTGVLGDLFGRKFSTITGAIFYLMGYTCLSFSTKYSFFLIGTVFLGIGTSFVSGSFFAWALSSYKRENENKCNSFYSTFRVYSNIGLIVGAIIGSFVVDQYFRLPWILSAITLLFPLAALTKMHDYDPSISLSVTKESYNRSILIFKESIFVIKTFKTVKYSLCITLVESIELAIFAMIAQPYFVKLSNVSFVGFLGGIYILELFATIVGNKTIGFVNGENDRINYRILAFCSLFGIVLTISVGVTTSIVLAVTFYLFRIIFMGVAEPIRDNIINADVPNRLRATILSFQSLIGRVVIALLYFVLGLINIGNNLNSIWIIAGMSQIITLLIIRKLIGGIKIEKERI